MNLFDKYMNIISLYRSSKYEFLLTSHILVSSDIIDYIQLLEIHIYWIYKCIITYLLYIPVTGIFFDIEYMDA